VKVFVAGASGAIGRFLVPRLVEAGHEVSGTTRSEEKAEAIRSAGAKPVVVDAFDADGMREAVRAAQAEVVVHQLTSLPQSFDPRRIDYGPTNRLRDEGTRILLDAAQAAGVRRMVAQSIAFMYAPEGDWVKDEQAQLYVNAPAGFAEGIATTSAMERRVTQTDGIEGLVLRYGQFYGPGTYYEADGSIGEQVRKRRFPIVGRGTGVTSFIHVDDAARATVAAVERGSPGIYNVVDDEPAPLRDWLPVFAEAVGAKPPRSVPTWLARLVAGGLASSMATELRGASNAKVKRELGWTPRYPSWRQGFSEAL
jgi:nucleoside-diphosphate-sugar epimerase